jgi:hypothetical protein
MAPPDALLRPRCRDEEDEPLLSTYKSTAEIKRSDTLSLVVILVVDRGFNVPGLMNPWTAPVNRRRLGSRLHGPIP